MKTILRAMRLPFLILTPVCVFLGMSTAFAATRVLHWGDVVLVLVGAVAAHISVNTFNEHADFRSGLDARTSKTPFSGGSGALVDDPEGANKVLWVAMGSLLLTIAVGLRFVLGNPLPILPLGLIGVVIILTYTRWLNRWPWLCLIAPGLGFGPLMVAGTHVALAGHYSTASVVVSLVPFFLVNNLLLLNQYPDVAADRSIGRCHVPIAYGLLTATKVYGAFALAACAVIVFGVVTDSLPAATLAGLIPISGAFVVFAGALKHAASVERLLPYMALNVLVSILTPAVLGLGFFIG
ncbi:MAG: prenyltransferase [Methylotetracoccus sp.]